MADDFTMSQQELEDKPHCYRCGFRIEGHAAVVVSKKLPVDARADAPAGSAYSTDDGYVFLFCAAHAPGIARVQ